MNETEVVDPSGQSGSAVSIIDKSHRLGVSMWEEPGGQRVETWSASISREKSTNKKGAEYIYLHFV